VTIKFNFYDIYGFALPGFLLLAVLWLPFGLIENKWPDAEFSSALAAVILAYFAGHLLQTIAHNALPSNFLIGERFPSSKLLDKDDSTFSGEFKKRLAEQINTAFQLDVSLNAVNVAADLPEEADKRRKEVDKVRSDAFFLCRSALIKSKTVVYAEQFEGLYALMRGLTAAFAVAVVYYLGWAYSDLMQLGVSSKQWSGLVVLLGIFISLVALVISDRLKSFTFKWLEKRSKLVLKWVIIGSLLLAAFAAGYYLGLSTIELSEHRGQLIAASVFSFFAAERCYAGYKLYAQEFAKAVYRDFSNYENPAKPQKVEENLDDKNSD